MEGNENEMIIKHEYVINQEILPRLRIVEDGQKQIKEDISKVSHGQSQLENTVMKDGQMTRELLGKTFDFLTERNTLRSNQEHEIKVQKLTTKEKTLLAAIGLLSSGGGIAGVVALFQQLG